MFCKNCGAQLNESTKFCKECGTEQSYNQISSSNVLEKTIDEKPKDDNIDESFLSPLTDSQPITILKQNYFESAVSDTGALKNIITLTNKWVHIKGRVLVFNPNLSHSLKNISFITKDIIVPLKHITGIEISTLSMVARKILAFLFFFLVLLSILLLSSNARFSQDARAVIIFVTALFFLLGFIQIIYISRYGKRIFSIHHIGGPTSVFVRWYSKSELENFRKRLLECIENIR